MGGRRRGTEGEDPSMRRWPEARDGPVKCRRQPSSRQGKGHLLSGQEG